MASGKHDDCVATVAKYLLFSFNFIFWVRFYYYTLLSVIEFVYFLCCFQWAIIAKCIKLVASIVNVNLGCDGNEVQLERSKWLLKFGLFLIKWFQNCVTYVLSLASALAVLLWWMKTERIYFYVHDLYYFVLVDWNNIHCYWRMGLFGKAYFRS